MALDLSLFQFINNLSHKWWVFDLFGIFFADYFGYFLILAALFLILKEKQFHQKIYLFSLFALSLILSRGLIAEIIKFFVARPRPFSALEIQPLVGYGNHDINMSFPSGHAAFYFALAFAVFLYFNQSEDKAKKRLGWWFLAGVSLVAVSRIFVGIHWPSDVLVGAAIGIASAFIVKKLLDVEFKKIVESAKNFNGQN
ncbi:MAG: phosphatase PAP2 family protein [Patescibacteria group bacterium]